MFQGASALSLDSKGRMLIPARYRELLHSQTDSRVTMTKHPDGCLLLFPQQAWEVFREKLSALPMDAHWWRRIFLGNASEVDVDTTGRVLVSPELRAAASLNKEITLLGMGGYFEIWDNARYLDQEQAVIAEGMPDVLKKFTF